MFKKDVVYNRRRDVHAKLGGNRQSGIADCSGQPYVLLFSNKSGSSYGYEDGWRQEDEVFIYTGEGQVGDMEWKRGNKAIRDHVANGKSLLLFEGTSTKGQVKFVGEFVCSEFLMSQRPDIDGNLRNAIQFLLSPSVISQVETVELQYETRDLSLNELRDIAVAKSRSAIASSTRTATTKIRERSAYVKAYVLKRADGHCEFSKQPAPFNRKDGSPYLEVRHVEMLAEGGSDDIRHCVAISPQIHREIHHGEHGGAINEKLKTYLIEIEK